MLLKAEALPACFVPAPITTLNTPVADVLTDECNSSHRITGDIVSESIPAFTLMEALGTGKPALLYNTDWYEKPGGDCAKEINPQTENTTSRRCFFIGSSGSVSVQNYIVKL